MKKYSRILPLIALAFVLGIAGCDDDEESITAKNTRLLTVGGPWNLESALVDDVEKIEVYDGLVVTFLESTFTSTAGLPIWPATGVWSLDEENPNLIVRDDDVVMEIKSISEKELVLEFNVTTGSFGSGRSKSISGNHIFSFSRP